MKRRFNIWLLAVSLLAVSGRAQTTCPESRGEQKNGSVSILGDSYSTYGGYIPEGNYCWYAIDGVDGSNEGPNDVNSVTQTWWHRLCRESGMTLDTNNSFSGSTVCNTGYDGKDVTGTSFIARMKQIGNPDMLFIFGGTNDSWAGSPLGEFRYADWTEADLKAFRPAMAYLLDWLRTQKPDLKIYFILNTGLRAEINSSVETICAHYGVPCIRLHDISRESGHPDRAGMAAIASQVGRFLTAGN